MIEKYDDYTIEGLEKEFDRHVEMFKTNWPDNADGFCISKALNIICQEIINIKKDNYAKTQSRLCERPHSGCY